MSVAIVTGSAGSIGSETTRFLTHQGLRVVGIDNDMRSVFFGADASTSWNRRQLEASVRGYRHVDADIRDADAMETVFARLCRIDRHRDSHRGTAVARLGGERSAHRLHRQCQRHAGAAGDGPPPRSRPRRSSSRAPTRSTATRRTACRWSSNDTRWECDPAHRYGIARHRREHEHRRHACTACSACRRLAADLMVQEYGRYFGMQTACFRGGCLTGPAHSGAPLHGFLSWLVNAPSPASTTRCSATRASRSATTSTPTIWSARSGTSSSKPRVGEVYNIGGSRHSPMLDAGSDRNLREADGPPDELEL